MTSNAHTHTTLCDGLDTPEAMAKAALALGFTDLGFSAHSPAPFDRECPGLADPQAYRLRIASLGERYAGRLGVLCGIELDYLSEPGGEYGYTIGSVHYLAPSGGEPQPVDSSPEEAQKLLEEGYGGDGLAMTRDFYETTVLNAERRKPDIIGHFDLITKFNGGGLFFDEAGSGYRSLALEALDAVISSALPRGGIIEVNTGAMARGLRPWPYPAPFLLKHMAQRGARAIITSDCHSAPLLDAGFDRAAALLAEAGFKSMAVLRNRQFIDVRI
jgi:histidinol-phosphatase (PHP family)